MIAVQCCPPGAGSDLCESLLDRLSLLHLGEVVVVQGHVGHDGLLVRMRDHHVLHLQQLHDPKLPLRQREGVLQVMAGVVAMETAVVKKIRPWMEREKERER